MPLRNRLFRPLSTPVLIAVAAALALVGVVVLALDRSGDSPNWPSSEAIFGERAAAALAKPRELTIRDAERTVTLRRDGEIWRVVEKDGYPARQAIVRKLLERIREPRVLRQLAADQNVADLGVGTEEGTWQRRVALEDEAGNRLEIVVGRDRSAPGSTDMTAVHVRAAGSRTVWLVDADLRASAAPMDWLDTQALAVPRAHIYELRTAPTSGEPLVLRRPSPDAAGLEPVERPDGDAQLQPGAVTEPASAFTAVVFDDVRRADDTPPPQSGTGRVQTLSGSTVTYWFQEIDGAPWARFSVERRQPAATDDEDAGDSETEAPAPAVWIPEHIRLEDWAFRLPPYTLERMRRALAEVPTSEPQADAANRGD